MVGSLLKLIGAMALALVALIIIAITFSIGMHLIFRVGGILIVCVVLFKLADFWLDKRFPEKD